MPRRQTPGLEYQQLDPPPEPAYSKLVAPLVLQVIRDTPEPTAVFADSIAAWAGSTLDHLELWSSSRHSEHLPMIVYADGKRYGGVPGATPLGATADLWARFIARSWCAKCHRPVLDLVNGCPPVLFDCADGLPRLRPSCWVADPQVASGS
jgi:hypothetical protein